MVSAARLLRALAGSAERRGCVAELSHVATRDWASATFVGARYDVAALVDPGPAADAWIAALPSVDLPMPRQFAREVRIIERTDSSDVITLTIEATVLED